MIITNSRYALVGYFIASYPTRAHGIIVIYRQRCASSLWSHEARINKLTSVFYASVLLVIDHEFRHHIVKVAVDPRGDSRVDPQTDINLFFTIINCRIAGSRSLTRRMNFKFICLSAY